MRSNTVTNLTWSRVIIYINHTLQFCKLACNCALDTLRIINYFLNSINWTVSIQMLHGQDETSLMFATLLTNWSWDALNACVLAVANKRVEADSHAM